MPTLIDKPSRIVAAGNKPKLIAEFIGHVNNGEGRLSVARMRSPAGWVEPGQRPEFDEFTYVISGAIVVGYEGGSLRVEAGQTVITHAGEWIQYQTPEGAEYIAICLPAFTPATVHRDGD
jgi:quercetin dioxygenase-like cupin family protein